MLSLLLLFLGLGRRTSSNQHDEESLLQITVPQKIKTQTLDDDTSQKHIAYVINIDGKMYTFHLEEQSFLHPHFMVYSYSKSGTLQSHSSFIKDGCFHYGYVVEVANSAVALNTCNGLRGLLQLGDVSYGIEPLLSSSTYEHMLYHIKNKEIDIPVSQGDYFREHFRDKVNRILVKSEEKPDIILLKTNLKIQIILDKALYDYMGSQVAVAEEKVFQIFSLINKMFSQLKMTIVLSSLELWSQDNRISTSGDADDILQRFLEWKETNLVQRPNDMAYLLIYRDSLDYVGAAYHGTACDPKLAAGIALYPKTITLEAFAVVMTQLLGINLGLTYDGDYKCYCPGSKCIMSPEAIRSRGMKYFSSCSLDEFKHIVTQDKFQCLQKEIISNVTFEGRSSPENCGNEVVEQDEQCDCGKPEDCTFKKCCNPSQCTLIGEAECGSGPCCDPKTCLVRDRGHVCRESTQPCDFTEYCNGTSEFCGPDLKALNFEPCWNSTAYCFNERCRSMDRQCYEQFGKFAKGADYLCTQEVNSRTDDFGTCLNSRCYYENVLCGKIVCHWTSTELVKLADYDVQYTYLRGKVCISMKVRESLRDIIFDNTFIEMGSVCGSDKYCLRGDCFSVTYATQDSDCDSLTRCSGHGVCNSNKNCQCDVGYAPPNCTVSPSSPGGSIDDGFWQVSDAGLPVIVRPRAAGQNNGLLISFYIFLPFLILTAIVILKWNKMRSFWKRKREEFISEDSSNSNLTESGSN